ncbi:unnamed protein product [Closterium sp. NIES-53]
MESEQRGSGGGGSGSGGGGSSGGGGGGASVGGSGGSGGGGGGSGGSGGSGGGGTGGGGTGSGAPGARRVGSGGSQRQQQQRRSKTPSPQQLREWFLRRAFGGSCLGDRASQTCGRLHTQYRCFSRLDDAWRAEFGDDVELPCWADLFKSRIAIFDLDFDAILFAMYALSFSAEGDCYLCVPPDLGIAATTLGASESGTLPGTAPAQALHTFTLHSGASRYFFRESTTLTPLPAPVPVRLADPSGGPVVARSSTVLPCPAVPSGSLSGLHLPSFSTNLVSTATLQDSMVTTTTPGGQRVSICTCTRTGRHLATSGSRLLLVSPPVALESFVAPPPGSPLPATSSWHALSSSCLWSPQVSASPDALACPALPPLQRGAAARRSSLLLVSPVDCSPADSPHGRDLLVLRLHSDRGGEFSSKLFREFCRGDGILQSFTLPDSPQQNGIAERRIGLVMEVARTSMIHAAAPHFLWPFAVQYAAHQLNLRPRVSLPETSPTLRWTGEVGDASVFRVWGSRAFVRDTSADKLSLRAIPCVFLGFVPDAHGWQFYHPTSRRVLPSQDVTFDESVPFYHPLPGPAPVQVAVGSGAARGAASGGAEPGSAGSEVAETGGAEPGGVGTGGAELGGAEPEGVEPGGAASEGAESGATWAGGARATGAGGAGVAARARGAGGAAAAGPGGARTRGAGAVGAGVGGTGAGGTGAVDPCAEGTVRPRPYFSKPSLQTASPLLTERREPVRTVRRAPCSRPPPVPGTHAMALRPFSVPLRVPLPAPPMSPHPEVPDPESDCARAVSPAVSRLLATGVTDRSFESATASALVAELLDFAAACYLDYATALVADSASATPPSVEGGECALGTDVLEDRQEDFECLAAAVPRFASMLLAPDGDPDAPDIPTPRSYAEAITGTYVDEVPPPWANIVDGMWIFRVKRPPGSPPAFKARYVARGFSQRQGVDYFQTFSPTLKMTTLRVLLHVTAQRDYELHSLHFCTAFQQGSLHEEIWLRRPSCLTESFPAGTQWSLRRPVYGLCQAPREWHDTLRATLAVLGFAPATADPSLFLRTDTSLPPFYVLVYVDDLVFATADTQALTLVKSELQKRHTCTDLGELRSYLGLQITWDRAQRTITLTQSHMVHQVFQRFGFQFSSPQLTPLSTCHLLSASPSDESVESSGPYPELVGCLMYLMTCSRHELAYPLSLLARYVALGRTKHIALRYFLARELQQRGQFCLAYMATRANNADVFTKALPHGDHQRFVTVLACFAFLDWSCDHLFSPTLPMGGRSTKLLGAAAAAAAATAAPAAAAQTGESAAAAAVAAAAPAAAAADPAAAVATAVAAAAAAAEDPAAVAAAAGPAVAEKGGSERRRERGEGAQRSGPGRRLRRGQQRRTEGVERQRGGGEEREGGEVDALKGTGGELARGMGAIGRWDEDEGLAAPNEKVGSIKLGLRSEFCGGGGGMLRVGAEIEEEGGMEEGIAPKGGRLMTSGWEWAVEEEGEGVEEEVGREEGSECVKASVRAKGNAQKEAAKGGLVEITVMSKTRVNGGNADTLELSVREEVVAKGGDVETCDPTGGESGAREGGEVSAWDGEAGVSTMNLGGKWEGGEGASVFECGFCGPTVKDKVQVGGGRKGR